MTNDRNEILEEVAAYHDNTANAMRYALMRNRSYSPLRKLEMEAVAKAIEKLAKDVRAMKARTLIVVEVAAE